jgi:hypothetical protein
LYIFTIAKAHFSSILVSLARFSLISGANSIWKEGMPSYAA